MGSESVCGEEVVVSVAEEAGGGREKEEGVRGCCFSSLLAEKAGECVQAQQVHCSERESIDEEEEGEEEEQEETEEARGWSVVDGVEEGYRQLSVRIMALAVSGSYGPYSPSSGEGVGASAREVMTDERMGESEKDVRSRWRMSERYRCARPSTLTECDVRSSSAAPVDVSFIQLVRSEWWQLLVTHTAHTEVACLGHCVRGRESACVGRCKDLKPR